MTQNSLGDLFTGQLVRLGSRGSDLKEAMARWSNDAEYLRLSDTDAAHPRIPDYFDFSKDGERRNLFAFSIHTLGDNKLIGECALWVKWNHQTAWLGIGIGEPEYRGRGYGTDAMRLLVAYGFRELGLYRIQLGLFAYNERARRSYEKVGFVLELVERQAFFRDGIRHDGLLMGLLRPEWEAQQQTMSAEGVL